MLLALWFGFWNEGDWTGAFNAASGGEYITIYRRKRR